MASETAELLRCAPLTYREIGQSAAGALPDGYHHLRLTSVVGVGDKVFKKSVDALMTRQVHLRAGLNVSLSQSGIEPGMVLTLALRIGPSKLLRLAG